MRVSTTPSWLSVASPRNTYGERIQNFNQAVIWDQKMRVLATVRCLLLQLFILAPMEVVC
eukprot:1413940-Amphidinium_carterae.1